MSQDHEWNETTIRELVNRRFHKRACYFQIQVALALYAKKDVVAFSPTGAGKTLSFWIPLLMAKEEKLERMTILVTPLNILGQQNAEELGRVGIRAVAVSGQTASPALWKEIENGHYEVVIINPELLMGSDKASKLWRNPKFTAKVLNIIFDEGHCISEWGKFRKEYLQVGNLRSLSTIDIPFYVASATLPPAILSEITSVLGLRPDRTKEILYSNDRPEISLVVQPLVYPANSFKDLLFLVNRSGAAGVNAQSSSRIQDQFLVFLDNIKEAEAACHFLRKQLAIEDQPKIIYFTGTMTDQYCQDKLAAFRNGGVWGVVATDAFGMGVHLSKLRMVVQYRATCDLNALFQRFGRAARDPGETASLPAFA